MEMYIKVPFEVLENKNLQPTTKLLYGLILSLCNQNGYCWANNSYFVKTLSISRATLIRCINELIRLELILFENDEKYNKRIIKCLTSNKVSQNDTKVYQNETELSQNETHNNI